jgi:hypothetical protein
MSSSVHSPHKLTATYPQYGKQRRSCLADFGQYIVCLSHLCERRRAPDRGEYREAAIIGEWLQTEARYLA